MMGKFQGDLRINTATNSNRGTALQAGKKTKTSNTLKFEITPPTPDILSQPFDPRTFNTNNQYGKLPMNSKSHTQNNVNQFEFS